MGNKEVVQKKVEPIRYESEFRSNKKNRFIKNTQ